MSSNLTLTLAVLIVAGALAILGYVLTPKCPACKRQVKRGATKCKHCGSDMPTPTPLDE
ncbi:MAG: zinc ribbon domain-containing protein [Planctomycetota bacterium]|jgi:tRNA(Ile2) C34 agmatinyltransferase TiaS